MHMLSGLLTNAEIEALHTAALHCKSYSSKEADSVDKEATFQANIYENGLESPGAAEIAELLRPVIEERLLPYVRKKFACPTACLADVLLRRYQSGERMSLNLHYDVQAFATAIIPLSVQLEHKEDHSTGAAAAVGTPPVTRAPSAESVSAPLEALTSYTGGLFVQDGTSRASRRFVRFAPRSGGGHNGDALFHQFDLMHGVEVTSGTRYALALWFSDSPESLRKGAAPWVRAAAERGNPDAQFLMATFCAQGRFGVSGREIQPRPLPCPLVLASFFSCSRPGPPISF